MRFSKKSEYALRALIELTEKYGQTVVPRSQLAEAQRIPIGFLEGILLTLKHAGIVSSQRGVEGGFRLVKSPENIALGQVIRTLDGPLAPIGCVSKMAYRKCDDCPYAERPICPIQNVMLEVRNAIANILDHYTLEDFTRKVSRNARKTKSEKRSMKASNFSQHRRKPQRRG